ncbi:MAG: phasin family protein [Alphaproteobacteria bacterium]|nr:phasin family protein [Alphaproteobacteria bacterium]
MVGKVSGDSRKPIEGKDSPFPIFNPAEFSMVGNQNMELATRAARAYFNGATKLNQEMMEFVNARIKNDIETAKTIMASKTGEEALHTQAEFVESAIREYADEASKVLHLAANMAKETLTPDQQRSEQKKAATE